MLYFALWCIYIYFDHLWWRSISFCISITNTNTADWTICAPSAYPAAHRRRSWSRGRSSPAEVMKHLPWSSMTMFGMVWLSRSISQCFNIVNTHTHMHAHTPACMYDICIWYFVCMYIWYIYISYCDVKININKLYIELLCYIINSTYYRISTPPAAWT